MKTLLQKTRFKEFLYQSIFFVILFLMYGLNKHEMKVYMYDIAFFGFYALTALFISYVLVPRFFYTKKMLTFWLLIIMVLLGVYFMEEYVLEPVLVGGNRGAIISNVFYTILSIFPFLFMMVSFKMAWDAIQKQQELESLQLAVNESELRFLKSQINPHFLFNNLNNLYSYAIENSPKTPSIILELSSVIRYMLYDCKENFVPLSKEIKHLEDFTALNELQIEDRGVVNFSSEIASDNFVIAPLILTMFVENAFKHSTASQGDNITIDIAIKVDKDGSLYFNCENSFLATSNNEKLSKGIGLENVRKRLELLYPDQYELNINDEDSLYKIQLFIKLTKVKN